MNFVYEHFYGLANLSVWGYVVVTLLWLHVTMMGVTLYFHRDQAHRSVDLHPAVRHFFRFWLWLNTGAPTKEWVAVHRKHHAFCEREGDPHSPRIYGLKKVLLEGAELYRAEAANAETVEKYGKGTPDDWLERNVYGRFTYTGIWSLVVLDIVLFGVPGIIMIALQLSNMPFMAAGVINGLCHAKGYRNFETNDASTNLWPFGLIVAGEELHNNHHAFPTSARFSMRPHEIDMGWLHLKVLAKLGLAKIRRVAEPPVVVEEDVRGKPADFDALRAVIVHRMHVLRDYTHNVTLPVLRLDLESLGENRSSMVRAVRRWLSWQPHMLDEEARRRLAELRERYPRFETVLQFGNELKSLWEGAHTSNERLLADFREWCARAEASGIQYLQEFAEYLKSFSPEPTRA
ncbi:MAG TPA: fatty acid desaturase [Gammaproteobacteria bacterium]|nr:fatty acid desaturase [Gammaproteobacteria bacterium]